MAGHRAQVPGPRQVCAAAARAVRKQRYPLVWLVPPAQGRARRPRLLPRPPPAAPLIARPGPRRPPLPPGWPSIDGGNEEFPLFRLVSRSSRSSLARSSLIAAACASITASRSAHAGHPAGGTNGTDISPIINETTPQSSLHAEQTT